MKERFIQLWAENIHRPGSDKLLDWLCRSDFFDAPASRSGHSSFEGGLVAHSLNVYDRLVQLVDMVWLSNPPTNETIAIVSLCHDLCKIDRYYSEYSKYVIHDSLSMGHGEASVYRINQFMQLTPTEAVAVRFHQGFADPSFRGGDRTVADAFAKYPLAVLLHQADVIAAYIDEA